MTNRTQTGGFDWFRLAAALLVIANHTGPLLSFRADSNYILTDILARLAVPFFFAVTGYFLVPRLREQGAAALIPFLKKNLVWYGIATLLCLPVRIYSGYFSQEGLPLHLLKDILFNGTFYHLWYFPAILLGGCLLCLLVRKLGMGAAAAVCAGLYLLGLLGDSYYAAAAAVPPLKAVYGVLFLCFDYTRSGLFFPPIFLLLGGVLAEKLPVRPARRYGAGFLIAMNALLLEGCLVKCLQLARFDALYLTLPVCIWFLMQWLRALDLPAVPALRPFSAVVYIVHPLCIVLIRGGAKVLGLTGLLVGNSMVHYLAVTCLSCLIALPFALRLWAPAPRQRRAWIELDEGALRHNISVLTALLPEGCTLMAVVKANAYGHGALETARACQNAGVRAFAVATAAEGAQLRRGGVRGEILVLGYSGAEAVPLLSRWRLTQAVVSVEQARLLEQAGRRLRVHIKVDTGMHRLGIPWDALEGMKEVFACRNLTVTGLFTHLAAAESLDGASQAQTQEQAQRFCHAAKLLEQAGLSPGALHIQGSYGLLNYKLFPCAYVRTGIALYGLLSSPHDRTLADPDLRPVLSLRARVAQIHQLEPGETAGYDGGFTAAQPTRLALVTLGYADGYPRALSFGRGGALIRGQYAPTAGLVCMDQLLLDVTDIPGAAAGDTATFIGADSGKVITAGQLSEAAGTITNEILSRLGSRLERKIVSGSGDS